MLVVGATQSTVSWIADQGTGWRARSVSRIGEEFATVSGMVAKALVCISVKDDIIDISDSSCKLEAGSRKLRRTL